MAISTMKHQGAPVVVGPCICGVVFVWVLILLAAGASAASAATVPRPDHVVIVIEENHEYPDIIGSDQAPYINALAQSGALLTEYFALTHPSEPNYLMLFSGSDHGVLDDSCPHTFNAPNLASELLDAGFTFGGYSESLPGAGSDVCDAPPYARRHVPWINFSNVPTNTHRPFTDFPSDFSTLPTISFVIPNLDNDMHDGTIAQGDAWLQSRLDSYAQWAQANNSLLIVTWDEGFGGNHVPTIFSGPMVQPGTYAGHLTHYDLLRTLEDMYGLPYAGQSASATTITDIWKGESTNPPPIVAGSYIGLFVSDQPALTNSGMVRFNVTRRGAFSGSLTIGRARFPFRGRLDANGAAQATTARRGFAPLTVNMQRADSGDSPKLVGTVSSEAWSAALEADQRPPARAPFPAAPGRYTVSIAPSTDLNVPPNAGTGTATVARSGQFQLKAMLGDGTRASQATVISGGGRAPIYVPLYRGMGALLGWLNWNEGSDGFAGDLIWLKPDPDGFATVVNVTGTR